MLMVGKMERMEREDFYNDDWNIDEIEAKEEVSEDLRVLMEDWENIKMNGHSVSVILTDLFTYLSAQLVLQYFLLPGCCQ